jgi:hypothetical protein
MNLDFRSTNEKPISRQQICQKYKVEEIQKECKFNAKLMFQGNSHLKPESFSGQSKIMINVSFIMIYY